jgi:peptidyl-prolyl cis-trans isomerase SurA
MRVLLLFLCGLLLRAEVIDRLALAVGDEIITEQQVLAYLRTAAFLNGDPVSNKAAERRRMAQKLIEVTLIRTEMLSNRYPMPTEAAVDAVEAAVRQQRFGGSEAKMMESLARYNISRGELRSSLRFQLAVVTFVDFRFRPGVQIAEEDLTDYYEYEMKTEGGKPKVEYVKARSGILELITQQRIDNLLDRWLNQTEAQTRIRWVEEAFQEERP